MPMSPDLEFSWFKKKVMDLTGVSIDSYRAEQMRRLLDRVLEKSGKRNYVEFIKYLQEDPRRIQEFRDSITINVSSLFRDRPRWMELNRHMADMAEARVRAARPGPRDRPFRVWSAGCSIGAEPYTIAMLLEDLRAALDPQQFPYRILATDLDRTMLARARAGIYTDKETREVPAVMLKRYFKPVDRPAASWAGNSAGDQFFEAVPALREHIDFRQHNILDETWDTGFDLIVCRNVIIYFTNEIKTELFHKFSAALTGNGLLFIGGTEIIFRHDRFKLEIVGTGIYRKAQPS